MDDTETAALATTIEAELVSRYGPMLEPTALRMVLGYSSADAFRLAVKRNVAPVPVFRIPNRRGYFALSKEVAQWLAKVRSQGAI